MLSYPAAKLAASKATLRVRAWLSARKAPSAAAGPDAAVAAPAAPVASAVEGAAGQAAAGPTTTTTTTTTPLHHETVQEMHAVPSPRLSPGARIKNALVRPSTSGGDLRMLAEGRGLGVCEGMEGVLGACGLLLMEWVHFLPANVRGQPGAVASRVAEQTRSRAL